MWRNGKRRRLKISRMVSSLPVRVRPSAPQLAFLSPRVMSISAKWFYCSDGIAKGPFEPAAMTALLREGTVSSQTLVWQPGQAEWREVTELAPDWSTGPDIPPPHSLALARPMVLGGSTSPDSTPAGVMPANSGAPAEQRRLKPIAPTQSAPLLPPEKPSLLRRLFGRWK